MIVKNTTRYRSPEAVSLLNKHKFMSVSSLKALMEPPMRAKKMLRLLSNLKQKGLVKTTRMSGTNCVFYRLSQEPTRREEAAKLIGVDPQSIFAPKLRGRDLLHHELCEYWIHKIESALPDCKIIREWDIPGNSICTNQLQVKKENLEFLPDFVVLLDASKPGSTVSIAFEIERTRKSDRRISRKLHKYAGRTHLDGMIYVCDSDRLSDTVCSLYNAKVKDKALRIGKYAENFFLFSDATEFADEPLARVFNANIERVDLIKWCQLLREKERVLRTNEMFREGVILPPRSSEQIQ